MVVPRLMQSQGRRREMELLRGSNSLSWPRPGNAVHVLRVLLAEHVHQVFHQNESHKGIVLHHHGQVLQVVPVHQAGALLLVRRDGHGDGFPVHDVCDDGVGTGQGQTGDAEGTHELIGAVHNVDGAYVLDDGSLDAKDV